MFSSCFCLHKMKHGKFQDDLPIISEKFLFYFILFRCCCFRFRRTNF